MTQFDANWAAAEEAKRKWMAENGLYSEQEEHSSCGVGLVVSIDGKPSRKVVENGIAALKAIWHRGAVDADGKTGRARDAQGYGRFYGQGAMAMLSRFPILTEDVQDFSTLLWRDLPGNLYPLMENGTPFAGPAVHAIQRLSSHGHWVVPIEHPTLGTMHILTFHATPPVFDGPEDRNGRRNHDEVVFWTHYISGTLGPAPQNQFILMGDANLDTDKGDGRSEAITTLLNTLTLQDPLPNLPTVEWQQTGPMRVDYILPSADWQITDAEILPNTASRHHLLWVDMTASNRISPFR